MINVLAINKIRKGKRAEYIAIFKKLVPKVLEEKGCVFYFPSIDVETDISAQSTDEDTVVIIEKWESVDALKAHMTAPHVMVYKEEVKDLVESSVLKVLEEA